MSSRDSNAEVVVEEVAEQLYVSSLVVSGKNLQTEQEEQFVYSSSFIFLHVIAVLFVLLRLFPNEQEDRSFFYSPVIMRKMNFLYFSFSTFQNETMCQMLFRC